MAGRLLTVETVSVPAISNGHVMAGIVRWTELADVDRSYTFVVRVFYDCKDTTTAAAPLYGANRLTIGQSNIALTLLHHTSFAVTRPSL